MLVVGLGLGLRRRHPAGHRELAARLPAPRRRRYSRTSTCAGKREEADEAVRGALPRHRGPARPRDPRRAPLRLRDEDGRRGGPEPIAGEFRRTFEEQRFGLPFEDTLTALADRVPLVDVRIFVTAILIQREVGGNLAEILDNLSAIIRQRFTLQRQVRVLTAEGR
jgi:hypothetical protein